MQRFTKNEFIQLLRSTIYPAHNLAVEIGGEGKVIVLRWALVGSAERTEKKVLFANQSAAMVRAAFASFSDWFKEYQADEEEHARAECERDQATERAQLQHLENQGYDDARAQEQYEQSRGIC